MLKLKGQFKGISVDVESNKPVIQFEVEGCGNLHALNKEIKQLGTLNIDIKKYRHKRSLDANSYFWVLVDKLAEVTGQEKTRIYKHAIKEIGGVSETVCIKTEAVDKLCEGWSKNGLGWQSDVMPSKLKGCSCVVLYYGSSTYDTKQMSMLIDSIVQDCKAVGIETLTPKELNIMKMNWKGSGRE